MGVRILSLGFDGGLRGKKVLGRGCRVEGSLRTLGLRAFGFYGFRFLGLRVR